MPSERLPRFQRLQNRIPPFDVERRVAAKWPTPGTTIARAVARSAGVRRRHELRASAAKPLRTEVRFPAP